MRRQTTTADLSSDLRFKTSHLRTKNTSKWDDVGDTVVRVWVQVSMKEDKMALRGEEMI